MSDAKMFDRQMLEAAFIEIDAVRRSLPETALTALAEEVVVRVAQKLAKPLSDERLPGTQEVDALCTALLSHNPAGAATIIEDARLHGASYVSLCNCYLGAAARRLGEWWETDKVSFYQVTIAAGRIYAILRSLRLERPAPIADMRRTAVFAAVPGENHTLGITIAADLARDRGWDIELFVGRTHDDLMQVLEQRQPVMIGLSAGGKRSLPALVKLIVALRISCPATRILLCGQIVSWTPGLVGVTSADAASADFEIALSQMERWLHSGEGRLI